MLLDIKGSFRHQEFRSLINNFFRLWNNPINFAVFGFSCTPFFFYEHLQMLGVRVPESWWNVKLCVKVLCVCKVLQYFVIRMDNIKNLWLQNFTIYFFAKFKKKIIRVFFRFARILFCKAKFCFIFALTLRWFTKIYNRINT